jgi:hypothetical protein
MIQVAEFFLAESDLDSEMVGNMLVESTFVGSDLRSNLGSAQTSEKSLSLGLDYRLSDHNPHPNTQLNG